jgi:vacuolar-type H+-ATPase subunit I/STV1
MRTFNIPKLERIIKHYKLKSKKQVDSLIRFSMAQKTLKEAIEVAAKSVDEYSKVHFHQRRVEKSELNSFAERLILRDLELNLAKTFDEIYEIINSEKSEYISELTIYDTAQRIGAFKNVYPDKIYLQSGTKTGAENLLGNLGNTKFLLREDLPSPFQRPDFTLADIEEILFQYKDEFEYCLK